MFGGLCTQKDNQSKDYQHKNYDSNNKNNPDYVGKTDNFSFRNSNNNNPFTIISA